MIMHNIELYVIVKDTFGDYGESFEGKVVLNKQGTAEVFKSRQIAESNLVRLVKSLGVTYKQSTCDKGMQFHLYDGAERYYLQRLIIDNSL